MWETPAPYWINLLTCDLWDLLVTQSNLVIWALVPGRGPVSKIKKIPEEYLRRWFLNICAHMCTPPHTHTHTQSFYNQMSVCGTLCIQTQDTTLALSTDMVLLLTVMRMFWIFWDVLEWWWVHSIPKVLNAIHSLILCVLNHGFINMCKRML